MSYFVKISFRKDFRVIFIREKFEFKKKLSKKVGGGQGNGATKLAQGKMGRDAGRRGKGRCDGERKTSHQWEIGPKSKGNIEKSF
jgi:hypothetical protein